MIPVVDGLKPLRSASYPYVGQSTNDNAGVAVGIGVGVGGGVGVAFGSGVAVGAGVGPV